MPRRLFKTRRRAEKQHARGEALCGIIVTAAIAILYSANVFTSLECAISDWATRLRRPLPPRA